MMSSYVADRYEHLTHNFTYAGCYCPKLEFYFILSKYNLFYLEGMENPKN